MPAKIQGIGAICLYNERSLTLPTPGKLRGGGDGGIKLFGPRKIGLLQGRQEGRPGCRKMAIRGIKKTTAGSARGDSGERGRSSPKNIFIREICDSLRQIDSEKRGKERGETSRASAEILQIHRQYRKGGGKKRKKKTEG